MDHNGAFYIKYTASKSRSAAGLSRWVSGGGGGCENKCQFLQNWSPQMTTNISILKTGKHLNDIQHMHFSGVCFNLYRHCTLMLLSRSSAPYKWTVLKIKSSSTCPWTPRVNQLFCILEHWQWSKHSFLCVQVCSFQSMCSLQNHINQDIISETRGICSFSYGLFATLHIACCSRRVRELIHDWSRSLRDSWDDQTLQQGLLGALWDVV